MAVVGSIASFGSQNMSTQNNINGFTRQMGMFGVSNYAARYNSIGANGQNENALAQNSGDAVAGAASVFSVGNYAPGSQRFNAAQGMTNAIGVTNPGLGYAASAQAMAQMYSPQTSYRMLQMGYSAQPLKIGGGTSNAGQLSNSIMSRIFPTVGTGKLTQGQFNTSFSANGKGTMDLTQAGLDPSIMTPLLSSYNKYMGTKGATQAGFNKDINAIAHGNQSLGKKLGINSSNIIAAQGAQAASTSMQGDVSQSFSDGLNDATASLSTFRNLLDKIVSAPGINQVAGGSAGALGGLHDLSHPKSMIEGIGGMAMLSGIANRFGGGMMTTSAAIAAGATPVVQVGGGNGIGGGGLSGGGGLASSRLGQGAAGIGDSMGLTSIGEGGAITAASLAPLLLPLMAVAIPLAVVLFAKYIPGDRTTQKKVATTANNAVSAQRKGIAAGTAQNVPGETALPTGYHDPGRAIAPSAPAGSVQSRYAAGGVLPGYAPGRDTVHAMLSPGEGVLVPEAVKGVGGAKAINAINKKYAGHRGAGKGHPQGGRGVQHYATGGEVASYAETFATGLTHPYVTGGATPSGWDCSGFSAYVYEKFGLFPGKQGTRYGTSETQYSDSHLKSSNGPVAGGLVFFDDGVYANPGHVGVVISGSQYVGADSSSVGTVKGPLTGAVGYRIPKSWTGNGQTGSNGNSGSSSSGQAAGYTQITGGGGSSTSEANNVSGGLSASGGNYTPAVAGSGGGGGGGGASGTAGSVGNVGPGEAAFIKAVLKGIGAPQSTPQVDAMQVWAKAEGGGFGTENQANYNPWNLNPGPGAGWPGHNATGAWSFPNATDGAKYTAQVMEQSNYTSILGAFKKSGNTENAILQAIKTGGWAQSGYAGNDEMTAGIANTQGGKNWAGAVGGVVPSVQTFATGGVATGHFTNVLECAPTKASSGGGNTVHLEFKQGSIVIGGGSSGGKKPPYQGSTGTKYDASDSARELITEIKRQLESEDLYASIAKGNH
jgi:hypothetical protein